MQYEVEQKFRVDDFAGVEAQLAAWSARVSGPVKQIDTYFAHPMRDYAATDEALRVRRTDGAARITYKGPKIDATTKTRQEIEFSIADGEAAEALWAALGFTRVAEVHKKRRTATLDRDGVALEVALDEVAGVGRFVELEIGADADGLDAARAVLRQVADKLGLTTNERRSYLEMLLAARVEG